MTYQFDNASLNHALQFATKAHAGQIRKYTTDVPYITHSIAVMKILSEVTDGTEMLAAALLHDTVEDCDVSIEEIEQRFGQRVASLVDDLTDKTVPTDGNRAQRRQIDRERIAKIHPDSKTIKLADVIHNTSMIGIAPKDYADLYMAEKREMLKVLSEGHPTLYAKAHQTITSYFQTESN